MSLARQHSEYEADEVVDGSAPSSPPPPPPAPRFVNIPARVPPPRFDAYATAVREPPALDGPATRPHTLAELQTAIMEAMKQASGMVHSTSTQSSQLRVERPPSMASSGSGLSEALQQGPAISESTAAKTHARLLAAVDALLLPDAADAAAAMRRALAFARLPGDVRADAVSTVLKDSTVGCGGGQRGMELGLLWCSACAFCMCVLLVCAAAVHCWCAVQCNARVVQHGAAQRSSVHLCNFMVQCSSAQCSAVQRRSALQCSVTV
jgi:hypothetical protein